MMLKPGTTSPPSKRGHAYNLNLAGSGILAPYGGSGRHNHPKCSTGPNTNRAFRDHKNETNMARDSHVTSIRRALTT